MRTLLEKVRTNKEAAKFIAVFLSLIAAFYTAYYMFAASESPLMSALESMTAAIVGAILSLFGFDVRVNGALLSADGFSLEIIDECTAIFSSIVYSACIIAYPTTWKNRAMGIAFGIPCLHALNITRLVVLTLVGIHSPEAFDFLHVYLWQASFIIFVVVIFLLWLMFVMRRSWRNERAR